MSSSYREFPEGLPVPVDDGAAAHLPGLTLPSVRLDSTHGEALDLAALATTLLIAYLYPRTGTPGVALPDGWDDIPGARGCTPQSCAYRDNLAEFTGRGARLVGISAQTPLEQSQFARREQIGFPLLSDSDLKLATAIAVPTFTTGGMTLYKRLTLIAERGRIVKVFYPVFPPDRDAAAVLAWLRARAGAGSPG